MLLFYTIPTVPIFLGVAMYMVHHGTLHSEIDPESIHSSMVKRMKTQIASFDRLCFIVFYH